MLTDNFAEVDFFLDELLQMLVESDDPEFRDVHIRTLPAESHKTVAAFLLTGPAVPGPSNIKDELALDMLQKYGDPRSITFLSFMTSRFVGRSTMKEIALAEAGPGRWVSLVSTAKAPAAVAKQANLFRDFTNIMGPEWGHSMDYIAVPLSDLQACLREWFAPPEVRPDTLGYLAVKAAVHGHRTSAIPTFNQKEIK